MKITKNIFFTFSLLSSVMCFADDFKADFLKPPLEFATRPLWFWNNSEVTEEGVIEQMEKGRDESGYGGYGILPFNPPRQNGFAPEYLSDDYFKVYETALKTAKRLGMHMTLYDEFGFPSGSAGGRHGDGVTRFRNKHPQHTLKRLDKVEFSVNKPAAINRPVPEDGKLMSAVAMEVNKKEIVNLVEFIKDGNLVWDAPEGNWKVMFFVNKTTSNAIVDYLDPEACQLFVEMTHQAYYDRFKEYFGTTIDGTFFDEPTIYHEGGRVWTGNFNDKFTDKHGFDPAPLYPALWYDIGPETEAARNYLFGFRAELYAKGFTKVIQDWATKHGISATGHQDQEEVVNQTAISGDLMLSFKYLDIPGIDKIGGRRAEQVYKVVSSSAYNWDKALVMSETYGAMGDVSFEVLRRVAMDQYTSGINLLIPHAVWYDENKVTYKPELSWRHPKYKDGLKEYNEFMGRLNLLLQPHGKHVADICILYPSATMQAEHYMDGPVRAYHGGVNIPQLDYVNVAEILNNGIGFDFTFLHPEVLNEKISLKETSLHLDNKVNTEEFKVLVLPSHTTINSDNLKKIKAFYDAGGKVIATGTLPSKSAQFGQDEFVKKTISEMFPHSVEMEKVSFDASSSWDSYDPRLVFDNVETTRWNAKDKSLNDQWIEISFPSEVTTDGVNIVEAFDRVNSYSLQYWKDNSWATWKEGETIGKLNLSLDKITTKKVRLNLISVKGKSSASISEIQFLLNGEQANDQGSEPMKTHSNANGGATFHLGTANLEELKKALDTSLNVYDVEFQKGKELRYIHKVVDGKEVYYLANLGNKDKASWVDFRGKLQPEIWNPHTGQSEKVNFRHVTEDGIDKTQIEINLKRNRSLFVTGTKE